MGLSEMFKKQCLVLGTEGSGKTVLIKSLKDGVPPHQKGSHSSSKIDHAHLQGAFAHQPTTGSNLTDCQLNNGQRVTLKECGGVMAPLWHKSLQDADMLIYVVDSSNNTQISAATVLLMEMLSSEKMKGKHTLLVFNKTDITGCPVASLSELKELMRVDDLVKKYRVTCISGSCVRGDLIQHTFDWLNKHCSL